MESLSVESAISQSAPIASIFFNPTLNGGDNLIGRRRSKPNSFHWRAEKSRAEQSRVEQSRMDAINIDSTLCLH